MGKKSKKGVSRAGTKHSAAGSSKNKSRSKSDGASVASKASRDAISLDNPDIAPSTLPAPRGPPPQDVLTFLNTLLQQQAAVNSPNSNAGDHQFDKENSVTVAAVTHEPEIKQEATKENEDTTGAPWPIAAEPALEEDDKQNAAGPAENGPIMEDAVAPVAEVQNLEEASSEEKNKAAITKPTSVPVVEEATRMAEEPSKAERKAASPAEATVQIADSAIEHLSTKETLAPEIETPKAQVEPKAEIAVVQPEIKKVAPVAEDSALVLPNADEPAIKVPKAPEEEKIDVWSSNLRDVVEEKKPVMDVTPPRSREEKKEPVIDATPQKSRAADASVPTLDTPDAKEITVKQNDCGCVIL